MQGTMLWFNEVKDVGFITTEDGERLEVHGTGFVGGVRPEGRCSGLPVTFRISEGDEGRRAEDVALVVGVAPRRARLRHGGQRGIRN